MMTFNEWLLLQRGLENPIGDLAADVSQDPTWPAEADTHAELEDYLWYRRADELAVVALENAWYEFHRHQRIHALKHHLGRT